MGDQDIALVSLASFEILLRVNFGVLVETHPRHLAWILFTMVFSRSPSKDIYIHTYIYIYIERERERYLLGLWLSHLTKKLQVLLGTISFVHRLRPFRYRYRIPVSVAVTVSGTVKVLNGTRYLRYLITCIDNLNSYLN